MLSHRLSMLAHLDQALAFGAQGLGRGKTPPLPPDRVYDYAVIGAKNFDAKALDRWVASLPPDATIVTGNGMGAERHLTDVFRPPLRKDHFGSSAMDVQVEDVINRGRTIVLVGTGSRVTTARSWLKRFGEKYRPPVIEIGAP